MNVLWHIEQMNKSFTEKWKSSGPIVEPWGTPKRNTETKLHPWTTTHWFCLAVKNRIITERFVMDQQSEGYSDANRSQADQSCSHFRGLVLQMSQNSIGKKSIIFILTKAVTISENRMWSKQVPRQYSEDSSSLTHWALWVFPPA